MTHLYRQLVDRLEDRQDRVVLITRERQVSGAELVADVNGLARALTTLGIRPGKTVALLLPNCPEFTVSYYAAVAAGALCVPANPQLKAAELSYIWNDSRAAVVVTTTALVPTVVEAKAQVPSLTDIIAVGPATNGATAFTDLLRHESERSPVDVGDRGGHEAAVCIYTSGTEGRPKGALLSHRNLLSNVEQVRQALAFDEHDNILCVLPLFHSFAGTVCQNTALACGTRITLLEQFHPARVVEAMRAHGVTIFPAVPAMYAAMMQLPPEFDGAFRAVRVCVSGGAPMPVALIGAFERRFGTVILEGDGPTECSPVTSVNPLHGPRKPGTIGIPVPGVEMRIVDDDDREVPVGQVGEIVVRGDNVMLGYLNQPEATAAAMRGGWYHTGDLGTADADGYFAIVDRKKDMLIVGGLNVYPREVEEVLHRHPAVQEAAVVGGPDARRGDQVVAIVALRAGMSVTRRDLLVHCRERLANYKCPRRIVFRDSLPRSGTGKVLKRLLVKELDLES